MNRRGLLSLLGGLLALGLALNGAWVNAAPAAQEPPPTATRPTPPPLPTVTPAPTAVAPAPTAEPAPLTTAAPVLLPASGGAAHRSEAGWMLLVGAGLVGIGWRSRRR